jgi:hypothetical protein
MASGYVGSVAAESHPVATTALKVELTADQRDADKKNNDADTAVELKMETDHLVALQSNANAEAIVASVRIQAVMMLNRGTLAQMAVGIGSCMAVSSGSSLTRPLLPRAASNISTCSSCLYTPEYAPIVWEQKSLPP